MEVVCPTCASSVEPPASADSQACPRCGGDLAVTMMDPCASDPALASLSVELREAFGAGAFALESPGGSAVTEDTILIRAARGGSQHEARGTRLGDFELLETLGRGGMGVVYRARQLSLDREVALKVLPPFARRRRASVARFRRESQAAARLHHTNIVPIYAQGEYDDKFYYAMELIDGESLDTALRDDSSAVSLTLRRSPSPSDIASNASAAPRPDAAEEARRDIKTIPRARSDFRRIAHLLAEVAEALEHAHRSGVIHRDIKPQNLLLGRDGRLHVTDFGLAHLMDQPHLTVTGEIMGTPAYMSPEQVSADAAEIDPRTDIYSLGVTLYELLTLRRPFEGLTREQVITRITASEPRAPRQVDPRIPRDLETICLHALEKQPTRRYASAADLAQDLRRFADERPILTRRIGPVGRALKWMRRRKALSAAIGAGIAVLVLLTILVAFTAASHRREAERLMGSAYDQLVYVDFQDGRVSSDLDRIESLGGDPAPLERLRALAAMGAADPSGAVAHLQAAVTMEPGSVESLYLLAWAQRQAQQKQESVESVRRAESIGEPGSPAEWFFRGLAIHFDRPSEAIESYQRARDLRFLEQRNLFPQATLHLARGRNQLMYRTRDITSFDAAKQALQELVENKLYGVYPYYLLSISNRLVAEVYADSEATRGDRAAYYFDEALKWARKGQELPEVNIERAITAEAEYHESTGNFPAAMVARTKAIGLAPKLDFRAESYGYRWRLNYWSNRFDEALEDLTFLSAEYDRASIFYARVYPILVHAEAGRMEMALGLARAIAEASPRDAQAVIWSAACLRLLGRSVEADELLASPVKELDFSASLVTPQAEGWVEALYEFVSRRRSLDVLLADANEVDSHWKLTGEAYFHAGIMRLAEGDRGGAREYIEHAYRSFDHYRGYTFHAQTLRMKWRMDASWPPWLPAADHDKSAHSDQ